MAGTLTFLGACVGMKILPVTEFVLIISTSPFFTAVLQWVWLSETITWFDVVAMIGSYSGIVILTYFGSDLDPELSGPYLLGVVVSISISFGMSLISVSTRRLKSIDYSVIQFYYGAVSSILIGLIILIQSLNRGTLPFSGVSLTTWLELVAASVVNMVAQAMMTVCNQRGNPATVGLLSYVAVFYSFMADLLIFGISFTALEYVGVFITLGFSVSAAIIKLRSK